MTQTPNPVSLVSDHRALKVWQKAMELAEHVYNETKHFPSAERFGVTAQIRRAAVSIPSNIAEGNGRSSRREYAYHLSVARGSLREVSTLVELSRRLCYVDGSSFSALEEQIDHIGRMLTRLIKSLQASGRR